MGTKRTLRTYAHRAKVDIASYCEGKEPKADDEVAIDRVFATNNNLSVGDKVELEGRTYTICGIITQPDSQALFLNNSDFTVNTITYGVAEVTDAGFAALGGCWRRACLHVLLYLYRSRPPHRGSHRCGAGYGRGADRCRCARG